jgi:hypothetical protein
MMAKPPRANPAPTPIRVLLRQTVVQFFAALHKGIKSLGTPKGLLATIPLVVSLIAFLKASYFTTNLFVLFIQPITIEAVNTKQQSDASLTAVRMNDFEMFMISEGREAVYTTGIRVNIVEYAENGTFDESCNYLIPSGPVSGTIITPAVLSATPLSKDYAYQLHSGFIVSANTVLPMLAHRDFDGNKHEDERILKSTGGTKAPYNSHAFDILANEKPGTPNLAMCLSGTAFTSSGTRQQFLWKADSKVSKDIFVDDQISKSEAPPVLPGGTPVPAEEIRRLSIRGPSFAHPIILFTAHKFSFF